jgi:hypothetical protein
MMGGIRKPTNAQPVQVPNSPKVREANGIGPTMGSSKKEQKTPANDAPIAEQDSS